MNATTAEMLARQSETKRLHDLIEDFRKAEPVVIETARELFGNFVRDALPRLQCDALETGDFTGKVACELFVDLSPGRKTIRIVGVSVPRPWRVEAGAELNY
jgi:hypothetical protein